MNSIILRKTIFLRAPRRDVWACLTEKDKLTRWFNAPAQDLREGETFEFRDTKSGNVVIWGKVLVARPPDHLEYTFCVKPMGNTESLVKWTLKDVPGGTELSLVHEGLPASAEAFDLILALDHGWDEHFMQMRKAVHPVPA